MVSIMSLAMTVGAAPVLAMVAAENKPGIHAGFDVLGGMLGAAIGFLMRPSVPLVGQLPLGVVLTRGLTLNGLDVLLRSTAEESFNYIVIGAILGAVALVGARALLAAQASTVPHAATALPSAPEAAGPASANSFCTNCGSRFRAGVLFCEACGNRRTA